MPTKQTIHFIEVAEPIREPITKFGGQPVWIDAPQWPLSRETGNPMRFIAQIKLDDVPNLSTPARMAYLFMTEEEDGEFVDGTYEPDDGENAIILQPGQTSTPTIADAEGPTLFRMDGTRREPCEFAVELNEADDVEFVAEELEVDLAEIETENDTLGFNENKLGGTPIFLQGDFFPFGDGSQFLLQLDSCSVPFFVNFGDSGVGYAFLNEAGTEAKFFWDCC